MTGYVPRMDACRLIALPTFSGDRGTLSVAEAGQALPFIPNRAFWMSGVPADTHRGQHAHRTTDEAIICLVGTVRVTLTDGTNSQDYLLDNAQTALYLAPCVWIDLHEFSSDALVLALASSNFSEDDYFRDWDDYLAATAGAAQ